MDEEAGQSASIRHRTVVMQDERGKQNHHQHANKPKHCQPYELKHKTKTLATTQNTTQNTCLDGILNL